MDRVFFILGSLSGGLSVALGAFAAHGLRRRLTPDLLASFETAARYQMYHALALLAVAWAVTHWTRSAFPAYAGWLFVVGTVLFSFSLYLLALGAFWAHGNALAGRDHAVGRGSVRGGVGLPGAGRVAGLDRIFI